MDLNKNGSLCLNDVLVGFESYLKIQLTPDLKQVIKLAFRKTKNLAFDDDNRSISSLEFRQFLRAVRKFYEYYIAFCKLDIELTGKINF
jgi:hypothetical protein